MMQQEYTTPDRDSHNRNQKSVITGPLKAYPRAHMHRDSDLRPQKWVCRRPRATQVTQSFGINTLTGGSGKIRSTFSDCLIRERNCVVLMKSNRSPVV